MEKNKEDQKKPLKLSTSGRLQIRKNLGPRENNLINTGAKKTIQIVFRNKNNQQKSSSTTQSNFRGSSSFRTQGSPKITPSPHFFGKPKKNFTSKNKKNADLKKNIPKKSTLKPQDDEFSKISVNKDIHRKGLS